MVELRGGVLGRGASVGAVDLALVDFQRLVTQGGRLIVNFSADWCPASRHFMPIFERASQRHPDVVFGKVDSDKEPDLFAELGLSQIPTVVAIYQGVLLYAQAGLHPPDELDKVVASLRRAR